jgi:hypothetical protein
MNCELSCDEFSGIKVLRMLDGSQFCIILLSDRYKVSGFQHL